MNEVRTPLDNTDDPEFSLFLKQANGRDSQSLFRFPTDALAERYLAIARERPTAEVKRILRAFLPRSGSFGLDTLHAESDVRFRRTELLQALEKGELPEFVTRRAMWFLTNGDSPEPWEGIAWVLDLLPSSPKQAITVLQSYFTAHCLHLPDGRISGIHDAQDLIQAAFVEPSGDETGTLQQLYSLTPRQFEILCANLYSQMGYEVTVTPRAKDGGKDVIARRNAFGEKENVLLECKLKRRRVPVEMVRSFGYVVTKGATRGVLIAPGGFTSGEEQASMETAEHDDQIELIDLSSFVTLMNANFGPNWKQNIKLLCDASHLRFDSISQLD